MNGSVSVFSVTSTGALTAVGSAATPGLPTLRRVQPGRQAARDRQPAARLHPPRVGLVVLGVGGRRADGDRRADADRHQGRRRSRSVATVNCSPSRNPSPARSRCTRCPEPESSPRWASPRKQWDPGPAPWHSTPAAGFSRRPTTWTTPCRCSRYPPAACMTPVGAPARTGPGPCAVQFSPGGELLATANSGGEGSHRRQHLDVLADG